MRLSDFLRTDVSHVMADWEEFAKEHIPVAGAMTRTELRDHLAGILAFIANDMDSTQTKLEQKEKAKGEGDKAGGIEDSAAEVHADLRFTEGFDPMELMAEFRALRASVTRLWENKRSKTDADYAEMIRFNESIDQVQMEGLTRYIEKVNNARNLFLATLVHDLRNPLGAVSTGAQLLSRSELTNRQKRLAEQIEISATRAVKLVADLIDDARARLGKALPISPNTMNIEIAIEKAVNEVQLAHPEKKIAIQTSGNLTGEWDEARIGQVLSNLIGNAIQHTRADTSVQIAAIGNTQDVQISVHNDGAPIPPSALISLFEPLKRGNAENNASTSLGLGLFIVKEIIQAHGGDITVVSTQEAGTTFSIRLPRKKIDVD